LLATRSWLVAESSQKSNVPGINVPLNVAIPLAKQQDSQS
jgi:hypothetical protein